MIPVNTRGVARYAKKIQKFVAKCVKISSQSLYISADLLCVIILLAKNGPLMRKKLQL